MNIEGLTRENLSFSIRTFLQSNNQSINGSNTKLINYTDGFLLITAKGDAMIYNAAVALGDCQRSKILVRVPSADFAFTATCDHLQLSDSNADVLCDAWTSISKLGASELRKPTAKQAVQNIFIATGAVKNLTD